MRTRIARKKRKPDHNGLSSRGGTGSQDAANDLDRFCDALWEWLSAEGGASHFPAPGNSPQARQPNDIVVFESLRRIGAAGFRCEIATVPVDGGVGYEAHWTHKGASFVGFKQPVPQTNREAALLAGCVALLANDWCRGRLA